MLRLDRDVTVLAAVSVPSYLSRKTMLSHSPGPSLCPSPGPGPSLSLSSCAELGTAGLQSKRTEKKEKQSRVTDGGDSYE